MSFQVSNLFKAILLASLCGVLLGGAPAQAEMPRPQGLFAEATGVPSAVPPATALRGRSIAVRIDHRLLRRGRFFLELPGAVSLEAVRDFQYDLGQGRYAWVGHAEGDRRNRAVIGVSGGSVAGTFAYQDRLFKLLPRADGSHVLSEVDPEDPAPELEPIPVTDERGPATPAQRVTAAASGQTIDILVAYTPQVESIYGAAGTEALIIQAVAEANQAYQNSAINPRLNLVHIAATDYIESGDMNTDISRLSSTSDGYMDELHQLRDGYGADIVSLIEVNSQYCGLGYLMTSNSAGFASSAFNVVNHDCATGYYSFAHEVGHNQGAHHDPANGSGAIFPYAYGHQDPAGGFRTVMAYSCSGCTRVDHFSNPEVSYNGYPTGVIGAEDNTRTINETAATVANFRQQAATTVPAAPTDLGGIVDGPSTVQLSWTDTSDNESGFLLERSGDGAVFSDIASLPEGATGFLDDQLSPETLYYYRVRAWNSLGDSGYSNTVAVTTGAAPAYVEQFATADLPVSGAVTGSYQDTWAADGVAQSIDERLSGGKPSSRYGFLEHKWTFNVQPAAAIILTAEVSTTATNDSFSFGYSSDDISYVEMFSVDASSSGARQFSLPASLSGTVYIRVRDEARVAGERTTHRVTVDQLVIRSENQVGEPPAAPTNLVANALSDSEIALNWSDMSPDEYGFTVERRQDGTTEWVVATTASPNATATVDSGLQASTLYHYRVSAFNGAGESAPSASDSAQTDAASTAGIELDVRAYKIKGRQVTDLTWTGAAGTAVDIYRDGVLIAGGAGNTGSYTDNIGKKGGGSYWYEVCDAGTDNCSNQANATFQ